MNFELTKGLSTNVDPCFEPILVAQKWYASKTTTGHIYAKAIIDRKSVFLHRVITGAVEGELVDHVNGDTLDNRVSNLRLVSGFDNNGNQKDRGGKKYSTLPGVSFLTSGKRRKRWTSSIQRCGVTYRLGYFESEQAAFEAYRDRHIELFGDMSKFLSRKECEL